MALHVISWDLPPADKLEEYANRSRSEWIPTVLRQPGVKEFRAYRTRYGASPQVMVEADFDSVQDIDRWMASEAWSKQVADMRALGCSNFRVEVWDSSPIIPEPLKPAAR